MQQGRAQGAAANDEGPVELSNGRIVGRRWKIIEKLGEGGCGSVYKVQDIQTLAKAALKAESNFVPGGSVLKLEVQVLRRLEGRRYIAQLLQAGKKINIFIYGNDIIWALIELPSKKMRTV